MKEILVHAASSTCLLLTLRTLPFAIFVCLGRRTGVSWARRLAILAGHALLLAALFALDTLGSIVPIVFGMVYYLAIALTTNRLSRFLEEGSVTRGGLFAILVTAYLLIPAALLPTVMSLAVGWDLMFSIYSYCVDTAQRPKTRGSLASCLFFLFVNPALVYHRSGARDANSPWKLGLGRVALGLAMVFAHAALLRPFYRMTNEGGMPGFSGDLAVVGLILYGLIRFVAEYAARSGLAHVRIGLMRSIGWTVPEQYLFPIFARSPADFWRRWNTYVRAWLECYVFSPIALAAARRARRWSVQVAVVVVAFAASGLLHDIYKFAARLTPSFVSTERFLVLGAAIVVWQVAGRLADLARTRLGSSIHGAFDRLTAGVSRLCFLSGVVLCAVAWR
jgi:hypothetical protein